SVIYFFFQAEDGIRDATVTGVQTCALPICPLYFDALRTFLHERAVAQNGRDQQETVDYPSVLSEKLAGVIAAAKNATQPVELEAGVAKQTGLSFNRRYHMKDGTVVFNPGKMNPNIVRPAGPIDPEVGIVQFRDAKS